MLAVAGAPARRSISCCRSLHGEFGSDHLAGVSIVASVLLGEYLAGAIVVLMLSGGEALEQFAVAEATSVLRALAQPRADARASPAGGAFEDVPVDEIAVGDELSVLPHEICPVDGEVVDGPRLDGRVVPDGRAVHDLEGARRRCCRARSTASRRWRSATTRVAADSRYARSCA